MVLLGLVDVQQFAGVLAVAELGDVRVSTLVAPVQEQAAVDGEVGMERDPEQALLGADQHAVTDVEVRLSLVPAQADEAPRVLEDTARQDRRARCQPRWAG